MYIGCVTHEQPKLLPVTAGRSYLVAFSGGPDSTMLLHLLASQRHERHLKILAAHINYRLRGRESDEDERFCRHFCKKLGIRIFVKRMRKGQLKAQNLQEQARDIRYNFFRELCEKYEIDSIATGHNRDDNVESVLMNLGRGAGSFGLGGIRENEGNIVRPLLNLSRKQILDYLRMRKLSYRIDSSNSEPKYLRNRVRLQLLPQLTRLFGEAVAANIHRSAGIVSEQERDLRRMAQQLLVTDARTTAGGKIVLDLDKFHLYYPTLQRLVIAFCYEQLNGSLRGFDFQCCERVLAAAAGRLEMVDLRAGIFAELAGRQLYIYRRSAQLKPKVMRRSGRTRIREFCAEFTVTKLRRAEITDSDLRGGENLRVYFDATRLKGSLSLRSMKTGDRMRPLGMTGTRKLSDMMIDAKIARPLREEIPILLCNSKIAWVIGLAVSEEFKLTDETKSVIMMEVKPYRGI